MKFSRQKFIRRLLNYYRRNFSLELPYRIIIDGTFAFEALKCKIQIDEQLKSYFETNEIICSTTLCAIRETELLGKLAFGAMLILKQYQIIQCHHFPLISPEKCFQDILTKDLTQKYILASQCLSLREYLHEYRPDLPTMLITHNSMNFERPSLKSRSIVEERKLKELNLTKHDSKILKQMKIQMNIDENLMETTKKTKKKNSQPNPLSIKKKKKKFQEKISIKKKRCRTRQIRMSKHLKEYLKNLKENFSIKQFFHMKIN